MFQNGQYKTIDNPKDVSFWMVFDKTQVNLQREKEIILKM